MISFVANSVGVAALMATPGNTQIHKTLFICMSMLVPSSVHPKNALFHSRLPRQPSFTSPLCAHHVPPEQIVQQIAGRWSACTYGALLAY